MFSELHSSVSGQQPGFFCLSIMLSYANWLETVAVMLCFRDLLIPAEPKTSSLFLFIGIGTYVAYRIWFKLHPVDLIETFCCSLKKHLSNVIEKHADNANTTVNDQSTVAEISEEQATAVKLFSSRSSISAGIKSGDVVQRGSESSSTVQLCKIDDSSLPAPRPSRCSGGGCAVPACLLSSPNNSRTGRSESCNSSSSLINGSASRQSCQYIWDDEFDQCSPAKRGKSSTSISPRQGGGMVVVRPADEACFSDNSSDVSHLFSRDPSEWSEVVALKAIGQCTLAELDKLHEHVTALRSDVESLDFDCTQYAENRQNVEMDLRHMYCSVTLATESESTGAQMDDASYSGGGSSCQKSASSLAQSEPTVLACCPKCGTCLTTPEQAADSQLMTDSLQTMISADMTSTSVSSTRALLLDSCFFSSLEESGLSPHAQRSESEPEEDHSVPATVSEPQSPSESPTETVGHHRVACYFNNVLLLDLRSFLSQHHVVSRAVLDYIVNELIQVRQVHNVLVPYGRSMNIIQACLYHICIFQTAAVSGAVAKSIQNFKAWFANCCSEQQRVCSASLQCLGALQNWLNLIGKYEYRNHINQFESHLAEFELAVKILVAWEVLLYHSSVIIEEANDGSGSQQQQQFATLDDSEATNIFANLLEKPVEDFSDTEIAVLARLFSITLEIFKSYASADQSEIWTTHPQQVTTTTAAVANRVNIDGALKKQKLFEMLSPIAFVDNNSIDCFTIFPSTLGEHFDRLPMVNKQLSPNGRICFPTKLLQLSTIRFVMCFADYPLSTSRDLVFIFMIGHFVLAKPAPLKRSTTKCQLKPEDGNFSDSETDGSQLYNCLPI
ncbi:hypothetical protein T01_6418 [Trichinella spiralis]|uniref:Uncharacterized protein n=1 Tax=Trichinella spiralis TaxID=6334 RepID=A0A0V1BEM4_TRISP|nr:hypothetical protein T01_6418 [Trichinella spiralis]